MLMTRCEKLVISNTSVIGYWSTYNIMEHFAQKLQCYTLYLSLYIGMECGRCYVQKKS